MLRKAATIKICLLVLYIFNILLPSIVFAQPDTDLQLSAKSAILVEATTGRVLFEKNSHEKLPPASITKIMTILLAMEAIKKGTVSLRDKVVISKKAWKMGGSQVFLGIGEEQSLENLLKAIAIASGNDASVAVAEHIMGSEEAFVALMNKRAKELEMQNTHFVNSHGLHHPDHYTTAFDIALMSKELVKHEEIFKWTTIWLDYLEHTDKERNPTMLANTNDLIKWYKGADGLKTGSHSEAKYCLAATAKRNSLRLIAVVLGVPTSKQRFHETARLLDYGFANYTSAEFIKKGEEIGKVRVEKGKLPEVIAISEQTLNTIMKRGEESEIEKKIELKEKIEAPVKKGEILGKAYALKNGKIINEVNLIAAFEVKRATFVDIIKKFLKTLLLYIRE
jgi:D-alanyl-D-alanine carboxypeptidase (penicillin-binding protein 5/6)